MPDKPEKDGLPNPDQRSAAAKFAAGFLSLLVGCLLILIALAFARWFYWDDSHRESIFFWDGFVFFLTKGPVLKIGGTAILAFIGGLIVAASAFFSGGRAVRNIMWICSAGIVLSFVLWIKVSQDEEVFGEISVMADTAFVAAPPEARIAAVSSAIDWLMGGFLVWWIVIIATVLGLREALGPERLRSILNYFKRG